MFLGVADRGCVPESRPLGFVHVVWDPQGVSQHATYCVNSPLRAALINKPPQGVVNVFPHRVPAYSDHSSGGRRDAGGVDTDHSPDHTDHIPRSRLQLQPRSKTGV